MTRNSSPSSDRDRIKYFLTTWLRAKTATSIPLASPPVVSRFMIMATTGRLNIFRGLGLVSKKTTDFGFFYSLYSSITNSTFVVVTYFDGITPIFVSSFIPKSSKLFQIHFESHNKIIVSTFKLKNKCNSSCQNNEYSELRINHSIINPITFKYRCQFETIWEGVRISQTFEYLSLTVCELWKKLLLIQSNNVFFSTWRPNDVEISWNNWENLSSFLQCDHSNIIEYDFHLIIFVQYKTIRQAQNSIRVGNLIECSWSLWKNPVR